MDVTSIDCRKLVEMLADDTESLHFLWNCKESRVLSIGRSYIPEDVKDPRDYMIENGYIDEASQSVFNVFSSQIEQGIIL